MKTIILFTSLLFFGKCFLHSQTKDNTWTSPDVHISGLLDSTITNMAKQLTLYPKEKLHLHIDRSTYLPGDTLWIKAYTVHSAFHTPLPMSRYVYVELLNPVDSLVQRVKLRRDSLEQISGYLPIPHRLPEGVYGLRAYTRHMLQEGEDYLYKRSLQIAPRPEWIHARLVATSSKAGRKTTFNFALSDNVGKGIAIPEADIVLSQGKTSAVRCHNDKVTAMFNTNDTAHNKSYLLRLSGFGIPAYERYFALSTGQEDYDISFYPEGGYLISNAECRIAYKALDISGNSIEVRLSVQDDAGHVLFTDSTLHDGMGRFAFTPEAGRKYKVMATNRHQQNKAFNLPVVQEAAYALRTEMRVGHQLHVTVLSSIGMPTDNLLLVLCTRGVPLYVAPVMDKNTVIDLADCPSGIIQCLLLDSRFNKLSERLCFNRRPAHVQYRWHTDKPVYNPKEQVQAQLCLTDSLSRPLRGSFSVSVTDSLAGVTDTSHNILSSFFLTSELKGYIDSPAFYFGSNNPVASQALDLLLMTHGWKRYNLPHIMKGKLEQSGEQPETACSISGRLRTKGLLGKTKQGEVTLINATNKFLRSTLSTQEGAFRFNDFEFPDGIEFTLRAKSVEEDKKKRQKLLVEVDPDKFAKQSLQIPQEMIPSGSNGRTAPIYYGKPFVTYIRGMAHVLLNTITVKPALWGSTDYHEMNRHEIASLKTKSLSKLLKQFGIKSVRKNNTDCLFYNKLWVMVFINGFPYYAGALEYISPEDVESMQFIGDMNPRYFQLWVCNGMSFNPYSKTTQEKIPVLDLALKSTFDPRNISIFQHLGSGYYSHGFEPYTHQTDGMSIYPLGYQTPVEFYSPKYESKQESETDEVHPTLFWQPNLQTDEEGCTAFSFYTPSNAPTTLNVTIEGVSDKGEFVCVTKSVVVAEYKNNKLP